MNLLYCVSKFPSLSESFVVNEIVELSSRGHNVTVFAHTNPEEDFIHEELNKFDIPVYYMTEPRFNFSSAMTALRSIRNPSFLFHREFTTNIARKLYHMYILGNFNYFINNAEKEFDLAHIHFVHRSRAPIVFALQNHSIPVTITPHAHGLYTTDNKNVIDNMLRNVDHIISPTAYNRDFIRSNYNIETDISVVPATSRLEKFNPTEVSNPKRILTVARMVEKKGYSYALEAVKNIQKQYQDIEYHIIGHGELEQQIRSQIEELDLSDNVTILKQISDQKLIKEYDEAEIFLLPCVIAENGDRDAMPVVLKEAMAMETACISTPVSGIPELITDNKTGVLVPPQNSTELSDAIDELLTNDEKRSAIARNGRKHVLDTYTPRIIVDDLEHIFNTLVSNY